MPLLIQPGASSGTYRGMGAWMLQPHNYTQIVRRNLYAVPYQRTGTYKGMGQTVSTDVLPIAPSASYIQQNFPTVATYDFAAGATPSNVTLTPTPATNWLPWVIGGVLLLALVRR